MIQLYRSILFDEGERTCFAWNANEVAVAPLTQWEDRQSPFVCLNPLFPDRDNDPESSLLPWAKADLARRADCNVCTMRNFLVEMDEVPLAQQWLAVKRCGMPFSTSVYSGKKSIHFVISLSDPCFDRTEYDELCELIRLAFPAKIDRSVLNPSRLTRSPEVIREETGKVQKLIEVRSRVGREDVRMWAASMGVVQVPKKFRIPSVTSYTGDDAVKYERAKSWLSKEGELWAPGNHNRYQFRLASCLKKQGVSEDVALSMIAGEFGLHDKGMPVKSAYSRR